MAERRSMVDALSLTPEKVAFIEQGPVQDEGADPASKASRGRSGGGSYLNSTRISRTPTDADRTFAKMSMLKAEEASLRSEFASEPRPLIGQHLVALTTRLQARTAEGLRRAYVEQKLRQVSPATQQEIVEEAVQAWLRTHGFLD